MGYAPLTASGRRLAVLASGPGALLSFETAGDHWGMRPSSSPIIHVTVTDVDEHAVAEVARRLG